MNEITFENFWNASVGIWKSIDELPCGYTLFADNKNSIYYHNEDKTIIIRVSDHWGSGIRYCNWYLEGYICNNSFLFQKKNGNPGMVMGMINLSDLLNIENYLPNVTHL